MYDFKGRETHRELQRRDIFTDAEIAYQNGL
jgi:hypothetical protein